MGSIERAERGTTLLTLLMIARCFGMTVAELLRGLEKRIEELRKRAAKPLKLAAWSGIERWGGRNLSFCESMLGSQTAENVGLLAHPAIRPATKSSSGFYIALPVGGKVPNFDQLFWNLKIIVALVSFEQNST